VREVGGQHVAAAHHVRHVGFEARVVEVLHVLPLVAFCQPHLLPRRTGSTLMDQSIAGYIHKDIG